MQALIRHLVEPVVAHPDDIELQVVEGDASLILEMKVNSEDSDTLHADDGRLLRALRTVVSAAVGRRKATLDIVQEFANYSDEE